MANPSPTCHGCHEAGAAEPDEKEKVIEAQAQGGWELNPHLGHGEQAMRGATVKLRGKISYGCGPIKIVQPEYKC